MALFFAQPSPAANDLLAHRVATLTSFNRPHTEALLPQTADELTITAPYATYNLPSLQPLIFENAVLTGWQTLVLHREAAIATAEVTETLEGNGRTAGPSFSNLSASTLAQHILQALEVAVGLPLAEAPYEVRLLRIPQLYVAFLWLHGPESRFLPLLTNYGLEALKPYREGEVVAALREPTETLQANIADGRYDH